MRAAVSVRFSPSKLRLLGNSTASRFIDPTGRRSFASSSRTLETWGFIGLGRMGRSLPIPLPTPQQCFNSEEHVLT